MGYPALLVGGGLLLVAFPAVPAVPPDSFALIPSRQLSLRDGSGPAAGAVGPSIADEGPALVLAQSRDIGLAVVGLAESLPPMRQSEMSLRLAEFLGPRGGAGKMPLRPERGDIVLRLRSSPHMDAVMVAEGPASLPQQPPSRRDDYPLRLAQVMIPRTSPARQPRWGSAQENALNLRLAPGILQPGQAGIPMPGPVVGPSPRGGAYDTLGDEPAVVFQPGRRDNSMASGAPVLSQEGSQGILGWAIPPIRWAGNVGYNYRRNTSSGGGDSNPTTVAHYLTTNAQAGSYIYAPWFAQVSGAIGLGLAKATTSGESGDDSKNNYITGSGNLGLFPTSRFPFSATFNRNDSRASNRVSTSQYTDTRLGLRQTYRSEDRLKFASLGLDHSVAEIVGQGNSTVTALHGSYSTPLETRFGKVNNNLGGRYSISRSGGSSANLMSFNSSHSWTDEEELSLTASSTYTDNTLRYSTNGSPASTRGQYMQMAANASWRPYLFEDSDDQPLTVSSGLSYMNFLTESAGQASQSQMLSANVASFYRFTNNLSANGSANLNYVGTRMGGSEKGQVLPSATAGLSYVGDPLMFGNFSYNWNTGANVGWQGSSGEVPSRIYSSAQAGHGLNRSYVLSGTDTVTLSASQGLSMYKYGQTASSSLSNNIAANYALRLGSDFSGRVSAMLTDTMTMGDGTQHYDSFTLGLSGFGQLSPRSSAQANLNFTWNSQKTTTTTFDGFSQKSSSQRMTMMGTASYSHSRFAGIAGLRYTATFAADTTLRDERMYGNADGSVNPVRFSFDNRLDYRIGRLDTSLSASMSEAGGKKNALLFFQVMRQIGSY